MLLGFFRLSLVIVGVRVVPRGRRGSPVVLLVLLIAVRGGNRWQDELRRGCRRGLRRRARLRRGRVLVMQLVVGGRRPRGRAQRLEVERLLPQEEDALLLQGGLDLGQAHQRARHLELGGHLGHAQVADVVVVLVDPAGHPLHRLGGPRDHVADQGLLVELGERRRQRDHLRLERRQRTGGNHVREVLLLVMVVVMAELAVVPVVTAAVVVGA